MIVHVYVGPTLSESEVRRELPEAEIFGPVSFGDAFRSVEAGAGCIAIIDGYFERVAPVWHKELLYALSAGVHVFGASSMGALRAAELDAFGMRGIGTIYQAYRTLALEDDDEVTLAHGSAEDGYVPLSEAMVNIRATLAAAEEQGIVSNATARMLVAVAKERFYAERSYAATLRDAESKGACPAELQSLRAWLPAGRVDQKALDARSLLSHLRAWLASDPEPMRADFRFERTDAWLQARSVAEAEGGAVLGASRSLQGSLEEELKVAGVYQAAFDRGAARASAIADARRAGFLPDPAAVGHAAEVVRGDLGLVEKGDFQAWCAGERLDRESLVRLFEDEARIRWASPRTEIAAREQLVAGLRVTGRYREFAAKAETKAQLLAGLGPRGPSLSDVRMAEPELWCWYFETSLGCAVPADLQRCARQLGFDDKDQMRDALLRELYCQRAIEQRRSRPSAQADEQHLPPPRVPRPGQ